MNSNPSNLGPEPSSLSGPRSMPLQSVNQTRKKRQRTTFEDTTHECRVCGKLFKRIYNWKAHMETHNPDRKYPLPCTAMIGDIPCTKRFQRKTDLDRHYNSVSSGFESRYRMKLRVYIQTHLKARIYKCDLCGNRFARKDTLRRHNEDGCHKRFDFGMMSGRDLTLFPPQRTLDPMAPRCGFEPNSSDPIAPTSAPHPLNPHLASWPSTSTLYPDPSTCTFNPFPPMFQKQATEE